MNPIEIDIQVASEHKDIPTEAEIVQWAEAALEQKSAEITVRIVDEEESAQLNSLYRHKQGPTNVLSFSFTSPQETSILLGDIVICAPLVSKEAKEQDKPVKAHWAHLTVHGTLHLQGFDHVEEQDAKIMQAKEVMILSAFGIQNPYE